uniref:Transcriptional regulator HTH-type FeoC domain-containing protein n=1 Tax=Caldilinea aerophila TaxID=133453 RepID=A0A7C1FDM6_9CHLR
MLWKVLQEIEAAQGPLTLDELSHRLDIDRSALEAMIQFWVRKGRLIDNQAPFQAPLNATGFACSARHCSAHCSMAQACPHMSQMPRIVSLKLEEA